MIRELKIDSDSAVRLIDKEKIAIERIKAFEPVSNGFMDRPYYVCYSGGKDSDVLRILFELSGVPFDLVHNHTTVDTPETVRYIRNIPNIQISYPELSMWQLIVKKGMPPTRIERFCCSELKERGGKERFISTGVRWAESIKRRKRTSLELVTNSIKTRVILNADNTENRKAVENCKIKGKWAVNPIIDWTDEEVWEFLNFYGCKSNPLYQCGYKRVGCIGCPMSAKQTEGLKRYPKYKENYIRSFERMLKERREKGNEARTWKTGSDVYNWWIQKVKKDNNRLDGQISFI